MKAKVYGARKGQLTVSRTVTFRELMEAWGPWAMAVFHARRHNPVIVGDRAVWIEIVP